MIKLRNIQAIAIIPARWASSRFEGKPLALLNGKPLLQWVWEAASRSNYLRRIVIATDDERIAELCWDFGAEFIMTPSELPSGTDRCFYAYQHLNENADFIINIQGDEPLLKSETIDLLIENFARSKADVGTLIKRIENLDELNDPQIVKVVLNRFKDAQYFSRSPIPFMRDIPENEWISKYNYWKHIGIYIFQPESLSQFVSMPQSELEDIEKLEQLRLLCNRLSIHCIETEAELIGVDTPEDLKKVEYLLSKR